MSSTESAHASVEVADEILEVLRERVMPILRSHGGGIHINSVDSEGVMHVTWQGACVGCQLRPFTVASVLEPAFLEIEGIEGVEAGLRMSPAAQARLHRHTLQLRPKKSE